MILREGYLVTLEKAHLDEAASSGFMAILGLFDANFWRFRVDACCMQVKGNVYKNKRVLMEAIHKQKAEKIREKAIADQFEARRAKNKTTRERKIARREERLTSVRPCLCTRSLAQTALMFARNVSAKFPMLYMMTVTGYAPQEAFSAVSRMSSKS